MAVRDALRRICDDDALLAWLDRRKGAADQTLWQLWEACPRADWSLAFALAVPDARVLDALLGVLSLLHGRVSSPLEVVLRAHRTWLSPGSRPRPLSEVQEQTLQAHASSDADHAALHFVRLCRRWANERDNTVAELSETQARKLYRQLSAVMKRLARVTHGDADAFRGAAERALVVSDLQELREPAHAALLAGPHYRRLPPLAVWGAIWSGTTSMIGLGYGASHAARSYAFAVVSLLVVIGLNVLLLRRTAKVLWERHQLTLASLGTLHTVLSCIVLVHSKPTGQPMWTDGVTLSLTIVSWVLGMALLVRAHRSARALNQAAFPQLTAASD